MEVLIKKLAAITFVFCVSLMIMVFSFSQFLSEVYEQGRQVRSQDPLIVVSSFHGYLPGMFVIGAGVSLFSVAMLLYQYRGGWYRKLAPLCSAIVGAGIVVTFSGLFVIGYYWNQKAEQEGYVKCNLTDQVSSSRVHTDYWVKDREICDNPKVSRWVRQASGKSLTHVNEKLNRLGY